MDARRFANRMQYGVLTTLVVALLAAAWSLVLGVQLAINTSVPGGLAIVLIAAILLAGIGWRIRFKWNHLHDRSG